MAFASEVTQRRALRRMKATATGLLLLVTAVYVATRLVHGGPWLGYVGAAAEAAMVGALADWFAVTALFRRPLGLPIPHTAIIPTRKDALGRSLESFVAENFLAEDVIRDKVARVGIAARLGGWLSAPEHAARVTAEVGTALRGVVTVLRDDDVQSVLEQTVLRRIVDRPWAPPAGRLLWQVVEDKAHHRLVDIVVEEAHSWLLANREAVLRVVTDQAPSWSPRFVDDRVAAKVFAELERFVREVQVEPEHRVRLALDAFLLRFSDDLRNDPATIERTEKFKEQLLAHPDVRAGVDAVWSTAKRLILDAIDDPSSELRRRAEAGLVSLGQRLASDAALQAKVDRWAEDAAAYVVTGYRDEIATVISDTVNRWDAAETSRKIELQVGRDLQFIRINGTVVGALAGLVIHAVSVALL